MFWRLSTLATIVSALTESWNGTSWTEVNDLNSSSRCSFRTLEQILLLITQLLVLHHLVVVLGQNLWNGTNWTEVANLNTGRNDMAGASGTNTATAVAFGGYSTNVPATAAFTEIMEWN